MKQKDVSLGFEISQVSPSFCNITVTIPSVTASAAYDEAIKAQAKALKTYGFHHDNTPHEYVKQNFEKNIKSYLEEFLFKHFVLSFLYNQIREAKLNIAGDPRISEIQIQDGKDAKFIFDVSLFPKIEFQNWKYYAFRAPKRKNYKDLDRQAVDFMKEEKLKKKDFCQDTIKIGDWVSFDVWVVDDENNQIFGKHKESLWLRIGDEEADREAQKLFLSKKIGDTFYTQDDIIQEYFGTSIGSNYTFGIQIKDIVHNAYFCFDQFKKQFRLKTKKELANQLVEIFSYRNDISQRQATVEEAFKLMFSKYEINIPAHLTLRQQKNVLSEIKKNPDYHVYKNQKNFENSIKNLAEKQIKEIILIDQLACKEKIKITHEDVTNYLNLTKRPRMKEFIYFKIPETTVDCQEMPISAELIAQQSLREKTINFVIYNFTRK
jgi:FKBP-type peptidyl-prolyl cis-trans isomerase (trigger factor)